MERNKGYRVYFRTGGTENFRWQFVMDTFPDVDSARAKAEELRKMGYPAHFDRAWLIESIGLPETYGELDNKQVSRILKEHACQTCGGRCRCDVPRAYCVHCA